MYLFGGVNLNIGPPNLMLPIILSGFAITSIFVPMSTFAVASLKREEMGDAVAVTSLLRNIGGSVGISLITTLITRGAQAHQAMLVSHMTKYHAPYRYALDLARHALAFRTGHASNMQAYGVLNDILHQQAGLWSYVDQFRLLVQVSLILAPLIFLFKKTARPNGINAVLH
jgi:MFS transporter, DHA2 family, multidrug resistance protein